MTIQTPSRATLQDVLRAIDKATDITTRRKQDMRSAVRLVAKTLGTEPHLIPADPRGIGRRLDGVSPLILGLSAGRWANCRSLLRAALRLFGPIMPGPSAVAVLAEWEPLATEARKIGSCWLRLGRLIRWLSAQAITPDQMVRADIDRFRQELSCDALLGDPNLTWQATRRSWERMRNTCPAWPPIMLDLPANPKVFRLPWESFPPTLKAEVDALLERLAGKDFSDDGPTRPLRPQTLRLRSHELRAFASSLVHAGIEPQNLTSLGVCLSLDNFKRGLRWLYERAGSKPTRAISHTAANLKAIARHWLKADEATLTVMAKIVRKLTPPEQGMSTKNRERLRPFDSVETQKVLVNLPQVIVHHIDTNRTARARKTGLATAALAIELLLAAPLRLENLRQINLDRHLLKVGDTFHLVVASEEVKNGAELEFVLPAETTRMIDWFIAHHRRSDAGNRFLFAGVSDRPKHQNTLRSQIMSAVKAFTGLAIHPHLFRHIAGSMFLSQHPGAYEVVRQVLGHRNIETTARFYTGQEERRARQHFQDTIQKLRRDPQQQLRFMGEAQ